MNNEYEILGHPIKFWIEVKKQLDQDNEIDLISEIADLRARVSFYESRILAMNEFMGRTVDKQ